MRPQGRVFEYATPEGAKTDHSVLHAATLWRFLSGRLAGGHAVLAVQAGVPIARVTAPLRRNIAVCGAARCFTSPTLNPNSESHPACARDRRPDRHPCVVRERARLLRRDDRGHPPCRSLAPISTPRQASHRSQWGCWTLREPSSRCAVGYLNAPWALAISRGLPRRSTRNFFGGALGGAAPRWWFFSSGRGPLLFDNSVNTLESSAAGAGGRRESRRVAGPWENAPRRNCCHVFVVVRLGRDCRLHLRAGGAGCFGSGYEPGSSRHTPAPSVSSQGDVGVGAASGDGLCWTDQHAWSSIGRDLLRLTNPQRPSTSPRIGLEWSSAASRRRSSVAMGKTALEQEAARKVAEWNSASRTGEV